MLKLNIQGLILSLNIHILSSFDSNVQNVYDIIQDCWLNIFIFFINFYLKDLTIYLRFELILNQIFILTAIFQQDNFT
jgi:hypothetical protein